MNTDKDVFEFSYICVYLRSSVDVVFKKFAFICG
jgi:hypothetical protein